MVLARLLTPEQFGTVAVVTVFLAFFNILADLGISTAIVQYKDLTEDECDGLFFFSLLMGAALALAFCVLGLPVSAIYGDAELVPLCCASAPAVLFATLNMVPNGLLLQRKRFRSISLRLVVASLGSGALAVGLALVGAGCYALVAQSVARLGHRFRLELGFDEAQAHQPTLRGPAQANLPLLRLPGRLQRDQLLRPQPRQHARGGRDG